MKNQRICPKCNGSDIVIVDGYCGPYGSGNNIMTGATIFSGVKGEPLYLLQLWLYRGMD